MLCFICTYINIFQVCKGRVFHFHKSMILFIHRQVLVFRCITLFMGCIRQHRAVTYLRTALKLCFTSKNTCGTLHPPTHSYSFGPAGWNSLEALQQCPPPFSPSLLSDLFFDHAFPSVILFLP